MSLVESGDRQRYSMMADALGRVCGQNVPLSGVKLEGVSTMTPESLKVWLVADYSNIVV